MIPAAAPHRVGLQTDQELDDSDHEFGITVPPLVTYLKKILRDYSDGQILKEILQNAEDAGATKVKFLYDVRQYSTHSLFTESLAPYQGPALYSYNNAKFTREDWAGIQKPARSNKQEDPLKVGRFGIGFNSVYHMTDLPSIMSDSRIAFLDPLERHFRIHGRPQTGFRFNLQSSKDQNTFRTCEDQFRPYRQVFDDVEDGFRDGQFDGTLFRFPLRKTETELSNKVYTDENNMDDLLDAFLVDADVVMLFLRSLKEIEVIKRPADQNSRLFVRVKANVTYHEELSVGQDQFTRQLMEYSLRTVATREDLAMSYDVKICSENVEGSKTTRWIVCHHIAGAAISPELSDMAVKQNLLPWTAIAVPVSIMGDEHDKSFGRVFCFLPLPPGEESRTGLPVHLHGFFGIQSDRRAIKWPGPDQTDVPAKWNELLVKEILPSVYVTAIKTSINADDVSVESIYCAWPDESCVHDKWKVILEPFFEKLFEERVIHSENNGWLKIGEVVFNDLSVEDEMEVVILKCLRYADQPYASLPKFCMQSIRKYFKGDIVTTTPTLLRRCIRRHESVLEDLNSQEKLLILEYIMSDGEYSGLTTLPLLPLDDGSFISFGDSHTKVYIPTARFPRVLIPGESQSFIRTAVSQALQDSLTKVAAQDRFQLEILSLESVATLLRRRFGTWKKETILWEPRIANQPPAQWLKAVWNMLYKESPDNLSQFEGLPLIPLPDTNANEVRLKPLSKMSALIVKRNGQVTLDEQLEGVLVKIGIKVLNFTDYIIRHPAVISQGYIQQPVADGILTATQNRDRSSLTNKLQDLNDRQRVLFNKCIANARINSPARDLLVSLPLFKTLHGSGVSCASIVSARESIGYIDISANESKDLPQPVKLQRAVIAAEHSVKPLLDKLKIDALSRFDVIKHIMRELHEGISYTKSDVQRVTLWLLRHWNEIKHKCESSKHVLQKLKFVPADSSSSTLKSPSELLDTRDQTLRKLFGKRGLFPTEPFTEPKVLSALGQLGMRGQDRVNVNEAIMCLDNVSQSNNIDLARSFLKFLANNMRLLNSYSSRISCTLAAYIKSKPCIPYEQVQPSFYPSQLQWYQVPSSFLSTPSETMLLSRENSMLCGSLVPLTKEDSNLMPLFRHLQMDSKKPTLQNVTEQLKKCVQLTQESRDVDPIELAPMVKSIYAFLLNKWKVQRGNVLKYLTTVQSPIWNGAGFSDPTEMCIDDLPFDMSPYMTQIPHTMRQFADLFRDLGAKSTVNANVETLVDILHEVKKFCEQSRVNDTVYHARQLRLVLQILKQLQTIGEIPQDLQSRVLVPTESEGCHLISVTDSAFVDRPWLKSFVHEEQSEDGRTFSIINPQITADLAKFLHVPPLSCLLLYADDLDEFTQAGQTEPLTLRIWNILKNTYEDTAIFKEMIQNAEDAGATDVRFLVDMRTNSNAMEKLFDPGMKACQGPALWVFNDATFTDEDFANILRLGGRTKEKNAEKIGKFGYGFNSVYHLTDVPCFVSRELIQYFDPHMTHLGGILRDKSQPGVRVNLQRNLQLRRFPDQFMPFNGVFGCRMSEPFHYDGSLFRLPLRSKEAALKSEISRENYDEVRLKGLLLSMWKSSRSLLIFTRKVMKVSVYYLPVESKDASKAAKLFSIEKDCLGNTVKDDIILCTESVTQEMTQSGAEYFNNETAMMKKTFKSIKATCEGSATTKKMAAKEPDVGLSPRGEVAMTLRESHLSKLQGEVFCYLPLSMKSMLPVHINGAFAVTDNRQHLHKPTRAGMNRHAQWNNLLLREVICRAYIYLVSDENFLQLFTGMYGSVEYDYLWPDVDNVPKDGNCAEMFDAFYQTLVHGFDKSPQPALFRKDGKALKFQDVVFLSQEFQDETSIKDTVSAILETHLPESTVVDVSDKTRRALIRANLERELKEKMFDQDRFFDEVFLPRLPCVSDEDRNTVILFTLNCRKDSLRQKLKDVRCIPVSGGDIYLQKPKDLVHPHRKAAKIFSKADGVFPRDDFTSNQTFAALEDLGMITDIVSAERFIAQCNSVASLCAREDDNALQRSHDLMTYLSDMLFRTKWRDNKSLQQQLMTIAIFPVVQDGSTRFSFLPWKCFDRYMAANSIYCNSQISLVSSVAPVLDESDVSPMPYIVSRFLDMDRRQPTLKEVMNQLRNIRDHFEKGNVSRHVEKSCNDIYMYLNEECRDNPHEKLISLLKDDKWILIGERFVHPSKVARVSHLLQPYLFHLPLQLTQYTYLIQTAEIKTTFKTIDYEEVLRDIYDRSNGKPLKADEVTIVIAMARLLGKARDDEDTSFTYLPDVSDVMRPTTDLCYSDVDWISDEDGQIYLCHQDISFSLAQRLNIRDVRHQVLEQHAQNLPGVAFGQHEKLTSRIKRILQSYSGEATVLKELLQNADDAGATKIHIVYDPRSHPTQRVFGDNMKSLQGPALCVFNNQCFSDKDIEGIQDLGQGSKGNEMSKIGRYGVGFNTVYHLSDCPSFISGGDTLCVFDPLCCHVPGASPTSPGRLYDVTDRMRQTYSDVFPCYLEDTLTETRNRCTVFRLPLRTEASEISQEIWNKNRIEKLLKEFEMSASESLLFLKNVTSVKISEIAPEGVLTSTRTLQVKMEPMEEYKKKCFYTHVSEYISAVNNGESVKTRQPADVSYEIFLQRNEQKNTEHWVICQQLGCPNWNEMDENSIIQHKLIPIGGVAARLSGRGLRGKAYCFLPLPIDTKLPVHVHGYFALDHESRRSLWRGSTEDRQTLWNKQLFEHVISLSYVKVMSWIRNFFTDRYQWSMPIPQERLKFTMEILRAYHEFFPLQEGDRYWKKLICTFYELIVCTGCRLFPVLLPTDENTWLLSWRTPVDCGSNTDESMLGFCNTLSETFAEPLYLGVSRPPSPKKHEILKKLLQQIGFPVIESPVCVVRKVMQPSQKRKEQNTSLPVLQVMPSTVVNFLRGKNRLTTQLPITISRSKLQDSKGLTLLLTFCMKQDKFALDGLPLLLTQDDMLRVFSTSTRVFKSEYAELFPKNFPNFLHKEFLDRIPAKQDSVLRDLDITAIAEMMSENFPFLKVSSDDYLPFDDRFTRFPPKWFKNLWNLLEDLNKSPDGSDAFLDEIKERLRDYAILPAVPLSQALRQSSTSNFSLCLVPLKLSSTVLALQRDIPLPASSALQTLGVCTLADRSMPVIHRIACNVGSTTQILQVLLYWMSKDSTLFRRLVKRQHEEILRIFLGSTKDLEDIKRLPCFETVNEDHVSIDSSRSVYVLSETIPTVEQHVWIESWPAVFLKEKEKFAHLYKTLGLSKGNEYYVYANFILPRFGDMSHDGRIQHLQNIKHMLLFLPDEERKDKISYLQLHSLPFIPGNDGVLHAASHFFDPKVEVFRLMKASDDFPPSTIWKILGLEFLREVGLTTEVTKSMFLTFAEEIEGSSVQRNDRLKSKYLVSCLQNECRLHEDQHFLEQVGRVKFLVRGELDQDLRSLHPPVADRDCRVMFSGSMIEKTKLVWTVLPILPQYAAIKSECRKCHMKDIPSKLGMINKPELSVVLKHTTILCRKLEGEGQRIEKQESLSKVLEEILSFLCDQCAKQKSCNPSEKCEHCGDIENGLGKANLPLVPVVVGRSCTIVEAKQISRTLPCNLSPFLYQLPDRWGPFFWLLRILGTTDTPSIAQNAFVLQRIFEVGEVGTIHPNILRMVEDVSSDFYRGIQKSDSHLVEKELEETSHLYLPSTKYVLKRSDTLYFNDANHLKGRISTCELPTLHFSNEEESIMTEVLRKLPERLRPKVLSGRVKEVLNTSDIDQATCPLVQYGNCEFERQLETVLHSKELVIAIASIVKHDDNKVINEEQRQSLREILMHLEVTCMKSVNTVLQLDEKNIANSEKQIPAFVKDKHQLYVTHPTEETKIMILTSVTERVNHVLGNLIHDKGLLVFVDLLSKRSPSEILLSLASHDVKVCLGANDASDTRLPPPGSSIPHQIFHLIEQDMWVSFEEGEYVALQRMDRDEELYIFARIVRRVRGESIQTVYLVDVGSDTHVEASVSDIHKIHIPKAQASKAQVCFELVPSDREEPDNQRQSSLRNNISFPGNIEEAKKRVSAELEEIWKLPEEERKKAIHRLMLKWHPDKHPEGPSHLFNEAFKHLQRELDRLTKGVSTYHDIFRRASQRASDDRHRFNTYGGYAGGSWRKGSESRNWQSFFEEHRRPDLPNARRWLRQAYEDLRSGRNEMNPHDRKPSFEWVSFKCHQSIEKGLKAAQLASLGYSSRTNSLFELVCEVKDKMPNGSLLFDKVNRLCRLVDYFKTRYPDNCAFPKIPHEVYSRQNDAQTALDATEEILDMIAAYVKRDSQSH
ncbi:sacsin-like [Diadema setosum]|uniref:sacsin-like n=1 Tax=Diadema setosum TaxID=31175 RepID=UPI003B3B4CC3